jgi:nicotinate-nucleotide adenylyltransferase
MKTGLFFGSFNPIHIGHMIIANFMVENTDLDQVWFVVSPHNPLKLKKTLAKDYDRLHLVRLAIGDNLKMKASDIEFSLPKPSYTVDTLAHLKEKYPQLEFVLIMGSDNLVYFHKWKNYETILKYYEIYVYQRPGYEGSKLVDHIKTKVFEAPMMHISASYIRAQAKKGKSIQYLVPDLVFKYLEETPIYRKMKKTSKE